MGRFRQSRKLIILLVMILSSLIYPVITNLVTINYHLLRQSNRDLDVTKKASDFTPYWLRYVDVEPTYPAGVEYDLSYPELLFGANLTYEPSGWYGDVDYYIDPELFNWTGKSDFFIIADSLSSSSTIRGRFASTKRMEVTRTPDLCTEKMAVFFSEQLDLSAMFWAWPVPEAEEYWSQLAETLNGMVHEETGSLVKAHWSTTDEKLYLIQYFCSPAYGIINRTFNADNGAVEKIQITGELFFGENSSIFTLKESFSAGVDPYAINILMTTEWTRTSLYEPIDDSTSTTNLTHSAADLIPFDLSMISLYIYGFLVFTACTGYLIYRFRKKILGKSVEAK